MPCTEQSFVKEWRAFSLNLIESKLLICKNGYYVSESVIAIAKLFTKKLELGLFPTMTTML